MRQERMEADAELLERALRGEVARAHPDLEALLARRPEWSDLLDELADGPTGDGAPAELRALARERTTAADRARMGALVAEVAGRSGPARRPRSFGGLALAAAALVTLAGLIWWAASDGPAPARGPMLGGGGVSWEAPAATVESWETFAWDADLPRGGSFAVTVRAADGGGRLLERAEGLRVPRWTPDPAEVETWPDRIVVTVEVLDASGLPTGSLDVPLERSSG